MNKKNDYKDNIIIALSVALVIVVIACCVLGVVIGIGDFDLKGSSVALAYVENDYQGRDVLNLESISITLSEPIVFDYVADSSITSLDVSFYDVFDDFIAVYNTLYNTNYTSNVSSGYGDFDRFVPICFVIEPYSMEYFPITTSSSFRYTLSQYNQPLTTNFSTFDIRLANEPKLYTTTLTCYGAKLSIPIEWNATYPGAGVLGQLKIYSMRIYYIEPKKLYDYAYDNGYDDSYELGYDFGYDDGLIQGEQNGYELGYSRGEATGRTEGYNDGYDVGYDDGLLDGYDSGYDTGYWEAENDNFDVSWQSLVASVFDAPLKVLIGTWQKDSNNEWQLVGGILNFEMPGLGVNFAPVLTSLFTLVILIVILRFVFSFMR